MATKQPLGEKKKKIIEGILGEPIDRALVCGGNDCGGHNWAEVWTFNGKLYHVNYKTREVKKDNFTVSGGPPPATMLIQSGKIEIEETGYLKNKPERVTKKKIINLLSKITQFIKKIKRGKRDTGKNTPSGRWLLH